MALTPQREAELERARALLHAAVDAMIGNLHDDGREGGAISEGEMPTLDDLIDELPDHVDEDIPAWECPRFPADVHVVITLDAGKVTDCEVLDCAPRWDWQALGQVVRNGNINGGDSIEVAMPEENRGR
jgi:hypothetical protein